MTSQASQRKAAAGSEAEGLRHVAIIMDGNGRWAEGRGLPRSMGHRAGVEAVRRTLTAALDAGLGYLTLFSFSSENWSRPPAEVEFLFGLLRMYIRRDLARLHHDGVRVRVIGERDGLPTDIAALIREAEALTADNRRLTLIVAFNYGARDEIARAARRLAEKVRKGSLDPGLIDEELIAGEPRHRRDPRSRPDHPHRRRTPAQQLPPLAGGLRRVHLPARLLAGLRRRAAQCGDRRVRQARPPVWRTRRTEPGVRADGATAALGIDIVSRDLLPRIASSVVLIAIAVVAAWSGGFVAALVVAAIAAIVHAEWAGITEGAPSQALVFTAAIVVALLAYGLEYRTVAFAIAGLAVGAAALVGPRPWRPIGVLYALVLGLSLLVLRDSADFGVAAIVILVAVVAATDIGAFIAGRAVGGPKLWPAVSPKKTWAGAVGGLISGIVAGLVAARLLELEIGGGLLGVIIILSVSSQCGDLFEFVRQAPLRRQGFRPPRPRTWRPHGPG